MRKELNMKKMATIKDTDGKDDDTSITETEVAILDPCLVVFEEESGDKGNEKHGGSYLG